MSLFNFFSTRHDFYIVELRNVSEIGRKQVSNWSDSNSLQTQLLRLNGLKTRWERRSLNILLPNGGDLVARRDMQVFDDFAAADRYYARLEKLFSAHGPLPNSDWVGHRVFLWAVEASSRIRAHYPLDSLSGDARLLAETDYSVILKQRRNRND
ncbi:MAG TPA: hypothetical protein VMV59_07085 [Candidatus Dormibacteraeota bacterium]|nr:hypothetical protein [Candidatus Dormibacteraeota bacterium]